MQDWLQVLRLGTSATEKDRGCDVWTMTIVAITQLTAQSCWTLRALRARFTSRMARKSSVTEFRVSTLYGRGQEDRRGYSRRERASFLDKIFLPPTVTHIGREAFRECGWLKSIRLPKDLIFIGDGAFFGCWELRSVSCPAGLVAIGDGAFEECFSLNKVKFNKGLKAIRRGASGLRVIGGNCSSGRSLSSSVTMRSRGVV